MNETALKARLKVIAEGQKITFNECWKRLLLERVLARIAKSKHMDKLVFKGGFFLSYAVDIGRETIDLDFLMTKVKGSAAEIQKLFEEISTTEMSDGFSFSWGGLEVLAQPHMNYPGFRVSLNAEVGKMRDKVQVDIGIGDPVVPEENRIVLFHYKQEPVFERQITLLTYPLESVFAEKLETLVSRGALNSRMKDYHDLLVLSRTKLRVKKLRSAINSTFKSRGTEKKFPIRFSPDDLAKLQKLWARHVQEHSGAVHGAKLWDEIEMVVREINQSLKSLSE